MKDSERLFKELITWLSDFFRDDNPISMLIKVAAILALIKLIQFIISL